MAAKAVIGCLHRGISRLQAEQLLLAAKHDGSYLIRESETISGAYTLCVLLDGRVHQYRILPDANGLLSLQSEAGVKNRKFFDLAQLVQQYAQRGDKNGLACSLLHPVNVDDDEIEEEEGEKVEELDNLQYEIMPPSSIESDYSTISGEQNAFSDFVSRHFMQRFSHLDLSNCDGSFIDSLRRYVQQGATIDATTAAADGTEMKCLREILDEAAADLDKHVENLMVKIDLCRQLFGPMTTAPLIRSDKNVATKTDLGDVLERVSRCKKAAVNLERKAEVKFHELSTMWKEGGVSSADTQCQPRGAVCKPVIPPISFEAKTVSLSQAKIKLTIDIQGGKLMAIKPTKNVMNDNNVFTHDKIEQLIKGTMNNCRLDIKITGRKKKTYIFEDVRQRENFCQLVQQLKNMHSLNPEVKHVSIFIGTWNMASEMPTYNLVPWLRSDGVGKKRNSVLSMIAHDIYVIGTQESSVSEKDWIYKLRALLLENFGEEYTLVTSASLWSVRLIVLVKQEHRNKISHVQQSSVKTGIANALGNKGAAAISFMFNGTSFCFICCHLTSGHEKMSRRNHNVRDILKGISLGSKNLNFCDASNHFHHLFFFGDLNYRLDELDSVDIIQRVKQSTNYASLLEHDQLLKLQRNKEAFMGFSEEEITFPPTYRFQKWTRDRYVWEKFKATGKRINAPSWCDRVLWRSYPDTVISNTSYGCVDSICSSDHKPVFASFDVEVVTQFTSSHGGSVLTADMKIVFEEIAVEVKSTRQENFFVEFHSTCLESPALSKHNVLFGGKKDGYCCPKWTAAQLPQLQPMCDDWEYLEDQHLLLAVKTADGLESYGECVLALKSAFAAQPQSFKTVLIHVGEETGTVRALMHLKAQDYSTGTLRRSRKSYDLIYMDTDLLDFGMDNTADNGELYGEMNAAGRLAVPSSSGTVSSSSSTVSSSSATVGTGGKPNATVDKVEPVTISQTQPLQSSIPAPASKPDPPAPAAHASSVQSGHYKSPTSAAGDGVPSAAVVKPRPDLPPKASAVPAIPPRKPRPPAANPGPGQSEATLSKTMQPQPPLPRITPAAQKSAGDTHVNRTYGIAILENPKSSSNQYSVTTNENPPPLPVPRNTVAVNSAQVRVPASSNHALMTSDIPVSCDTLSSGEQQYEDVLRIPSSIKEWLGDLGLSQYHDQFIANGWDHINFVYDMADEDLVLVGVVSPEDRTRILHSISLLKND